VVVVVVGWRWSSINLKKLDEHTNIVGLAQDILDHCDLIHVSKMGRLIGEQGATQSGLLVAVRPRKSMRRKGAVCSTTWAGRTEC
jgi:hypothetical protein